MQGRTGVTGVLERWDPAGTLRAIARMQPAVRNLLVVHDQSESGLGTRADLEAVLPEFQDRFRFEYLLQEPLEATLERLAHLPDGWAVLLMGYNVDAAGKVLDSRDTGSILASRSRAPIYTMDETRFGDGVVGGSLLTGERQGEVAAGMVARILAGTAADAIPVARDPVATLRFDHRALERFAIPEASLPPGSTVTNLPFSYYQRHPLPGLGTGRLRRGLDGAVRRAGRERPLPAPRGGGAPGQRGEPAHHARLHRGRRHRHRRPGERDPDEPHRRGADRLDPGGGPRAPAGRGLPHGPGRRRRGGEPGGARPARGQAGLDAGAGEPAGA